MYISYYNLKKKPFQISADPAFLWLGEKHREALATLKYGILDNKGVLLITGDIGTGKTTLINALTTRLEKEVIVARVPDPGMELIDLMNYISHAFGMGKEFARKDLFLVHFGHFLNTAYTQRKKVVLIIDEAQRLSQELLEEVRQLSNLERNDSKLLNIFLIGQNEFNKMLQQDQSRSLRQRITMFYNLERLNEQETGALIHHRLSVAGAKSEIFTMEALSEVYRHTGGTPRKINILCDHCLIAGFVEGERIIDAEMVAATARKLALPVNSSAPVDIGDLLPNEDLFDDEDTPEPKRTEDDEVEKSEKDLLPPKKTRSTVSRVAVLCSFILTVFIYFFQGFGDAASNIWRVGGDVVSTVVDGGTRLAGQQRELVKKAVSSVVLEGEPQKSTQGIGVRQKSAFRANDNFSSPSGLHAADQSEQPEETYIQESGVSGLGTAESEIRAEASDQLHSEEITVERGQQTIADSQVDTAEDPHEPELAQMPGENEQVDSIEPDVTVEQVVKEVKELTEEGSDFQLPEDEIKIVKEPTDSSVVVSMATEVENTKESDERVESESVPEQDGATWQQPEPIDSSKVIEWLMQNRGRKR